VNHRAFLLPKYLNCYLITDSDSQNLLHVVQEAVAGGVTLVQLRDKSASDHELIVQGQKLLSLLRPMGVPLIMNDRVSVAKALGVGVHLGQGDADPIWARKVLGSDIWLGLTIHNDIALAHSFQKVVDYVGVGPVFPTETKADALSVVGLIQLAEVCAASPLPVVAIGGITPKNVAAVRASGCAGIALCGAIFRAEDPREAARLLSL